MKHQALPATSAIGCLTSTFSTIPRNHNDAPVLQLSGKTVLLQITHREVNEFWYMVDPYHNGILC
jgi:hypothetical protein